MKAKFISLEMCQDYFDYDLDGNLFWKIARQNIRKGSFAGFLHNSYFRVGVEGKQYQVHRILYQLYHNIELNDEFVDHINGIKTDNRKENLRLCTKSENCMNRKVQKSNKSTGIKNISIMKSKDYEYFHIQISKNGEYVYSKCFRTDKFTLEDVIKIRDEKLKEFHKDFSKII